MVSHLSSKGDNCCDDLYRQQTVQKGGLLFNPVALRKAKIANNFGLSECNRVKRRHQLNKNANEKRIKK